jgi:acetyltransferase-like isoleucine patch superfamily enzyme
MVFQNIFKSLLYRLKRELKPEMIGGFKYAKGKTGIRISNNSHISFPENLKLGNNVFIGHFNYIDCFHEITIENGVQITNYCSILNHSSHNSIRLHGEHYLEDCQSELIGLTEGPVKIGEYTYIGAHSVIMPGTTLGKGCIVGAFSYVKPGIYPDFSILRGIPAVVTGDTRAIDEEFLKKFPELRDKYYIK